MYKQLNNIFIHYKNNNYIYATHITNTIIMFLSLLYLQNFVSGSSFLLTDTSCAFIVEIKNFLWLISNFQH